MENTHISGLYKASKWVVVITVCLDSVAILMSALLRLFLIEWGDPAVFDIETEVRLSMIAQGQVWLAFVYSIITVTSGVLWFKCRRFLKFILLLSIAIVIGMLVNSVVQNYPFTTLRYFFSAISWRRIGGSLLLTIYHLFVFVLILVEPILSGRHNRPDPTVRSPLVENAPLSTAEKNISEIDAHTPQPVDTLTPSNLTSRFVSVVLIIDGLVILLVMTIQLIMALLSTHRIGMYSDLFVVRYYTEIIFIGFIFSIAYLVACLKYLSNWRKGLQSGFIGTIIVSLVALGAIIFLISYIFPLSPRDSLFWFNLIRFYSIYLILALANLFAFFLILGERLRVIQLKKEKCETCDQNENNLPPDSSIQ